MFLLIEVGHYEDSLKEKKRMIILSSNGFLFRVGEAGGEVCAGQLVVQNHGERHFVGQKNQQESGDGLSTNV